MPLPIPAGADLNDYTTPGMYCALTDDIANAITNAPAPRAFSLFVEQGADGQVVQTAKTWTDGTAYIATVYIRNQYPLWGSGWVLIPTATPPAEHPLPLAEGVRAVMMTRYRREQNSEVSINISIGPMDGHTMQNNQIVATLPAGYRAEGDVAFPESKDGFFMTNALGQIAWIGSSVSTGYRSGYVEFVAVGDA